MSSSTGITVVPTIFREYIGCKKGSSLTDFPAEIINDNVKEFHFILAFATETGDGKFTPSWNTESFSPEKITKLKHDHNNVKVVISIGGRGSTFNSNNSKWLFNAKSSIKAIIDNYNKNIDGIDVYYDNIPNTNDFRDSIGNLITCLKDDRYIEIVSIAPSKAVDAQYKALYDSYKKDIDWVDYRFYDQTFSDTPTFVQSYLDLAEDYPSILLPGCSTDPRDEVKLPLQIFLEGCRQLRRSNLLPGIFVFGIWVELIAQGIIVDSNPPT